MKAEPLRPSFRRPTPLIRKTSPPLHPTPPKQQESLQDGLAICLIGFQKTMYDSEYEHELRKRAVMAVNLATQYISLTKGVSLLDVDV